MSNQLYPAAVRGLTFTVMKAFEFNTLEQTAPSKVQLRIAQTQNPIWHWSLIYDYLKNIATDIAPGLTYTDLQTLMGFCLARLGSFDDFLFTDPDDNSVGPALIAGVPNTAAQLQVVNDGAGHYYSPVQRNMGGQFYEDVTDLNGAITVYANAVLQTGGGTNYTLAGPGLTIPGNSFMGLYLAWVNPPAWQASHAYALNATILDPAGHIQKVTTTGTSGATQPTFNDAGGTTTDGTVTWTDQGYNPGPATPVTAQFNFYFRVHFEMDQQDFEKFMGFIWTIGGSGSKNGSGMLKIASSRAALV